ncbi:dDENN domain protein [Trichuris suis]|nr:dDENN domain protein [Trichuris suis]
MLFIWCIILWSSMASRLRTDTGTIFDVFAEVASDGTTSWVLWKYPDNFSDDECSPKTVFFTETSPVHCRILLPVSYDKVYYTTSVLIPLSNFVFSDAVQLFSFVLTDLTGAYTFGFCRHTPRSSTCFCFLSAFPWPELFFKLLNHVATVADQSPPSVVELLLANAYHCRIPLPNQSLVLFSTPGADRFECSCPDTSELPKIPENVAQIISSLIGIKFSFLALPDRILQCCERKQHDCSICQYAVRAQNYFYRWKSGQTQRLRNGGKPFNISDALFSARRFHGWFLLKAAHFYSGSSCSSLSLLECSNALHDWCAIRILQGKLKMVATIKKNLRPSNMIGDGIARSFLRGLVVLIGGYREALQFRSGESITFNPDSFLQSRPVHMRPFLAKILELQIFQQFIDDRLDRLNKGVGLRDHFEEECNFYSGKDSSKFRHQYSEWMSNMKKEGGALVRQIRNKVRSKSKEAISDIRNIIADLKDESSSRVGDQSESLRELHNPALRVRERENYVRKGTRGSLVANEIMRAILKECGFQLRQRRSLHSKPTRSSKWTQLNLNRDEQGFGESLEGATRHSVPSIPEEQNSDSLDSLEKESSSQFNLMSEMEEYLARRTSLLSRLEEQITRNPVGNSSQDTGSDLIDLKNDTSKEVAKSSATNAGAATSEVQSNLEILKCIFSPPIASAPLQTQGNDAIHCDNWETFD